MHLVQSMRRLPSWALPLVLGIIVVLLPQLGVGLSLQRQIVLTAILALLVSGLNLSLGYAGELALGGAAVYAVGAYVSGYLGVHGHTDILLQLVVSGVIALVVGLVTGIPGLRLGNWSLAMTSFFLVLLVPDLIALFPDQTGGRIGLAGIQLPTLFGHALDQEAYYVFVTVVTLLWLLVMRNLVVSRHGIAFRVLRQSPVLAASNGISVYRLKLTAYALGAVPAGFAGTLFANLDHYISPDAFGFALAISILAASILGGSMSVYGAVAGAAIMQFGPMESTSFQKYALVVYGAFLIVGGVVLSEGLAGICRRVLRRARTMVAARLAAGDKSAHDVAPDQAAAADIGTLPGAALRVSGLSKSFAGIKALSDVTLQAEPGKVTAVIGPNGSGKTTLLNAISGFYRADSGTIVVGDSSPRTRRPHQLARAGITRTFQTPLVPTGITVEQAVAAGRYMAQYRSMLSTILRLPGYRRTRNADHVEACRVLALIGIEDLADADAASLPLGTRRLLEVARALIAKPRLVLLDEAASGLDEDEVDKLAVLVARIRDAGGTVILVEHNFGLVLSLADRIHVLAQGRLIASGSAAEIENDPAVLREYLGIEADENTADDAIETFAQARAEADQLVEPQAPEPMDAELARPTAVRVEKGSSA
jgi:branched-chain amino acid transport system permease protein